MIDINSENFFYQKNFEDLFFQKNYQLSSQKKFLTVKIRDEKNHIIVNANDERISFLKPVVFNEFFKKTIFIILRTKIFFNSTDYYPFRHLIEYKGSSYKFKNFNNILFGNLVLYYPEGIKKVDLYKKIWPTDKQIIMNKLDTHLTNLKVDLKKYINFDLNFRSKNGVINLIIN